MAERTVKIAAFSYFEKQPLLVTADGRVTDDPEHGEPVIDESGSEVTIKVRRLARQGDTLGELSEEDEARAQDLGVFDDPPPMPGLVDRDAGPPTAGDDTSPADDPEGWLREQRPSVKDVVSAAGSDPVLAARLLDAESAVTDGKPRKGVVEGLTAIVEAAGGDTSPADA